MKRLLFACFTLLGVTACSSSSTSSSSEDVFRRLAASECDRLARCDLEGGVNDRAVVTSTDECTANVEAVLLTRFGESAFLGDGSVAIDEANLSACLAALDASPCISADDVPACDVIFVGTLGEGAPCSDGVQCVSGSCTALPNQCGTCAAPAGIGETCNPVADNCAPSPQGDVTCEPNVTFSGTCVLDTSEHLMVGLNESCDTAGGVVRHCEPPYYCDANDLCAERKADGNPCDPDFDECGLGAVCADTPAGPTCLAIVDVTTANEPCGLLPDDTLGRCDSRSDLYCGENGTGETVCLALAGSGAENSECLKASDCNEGLICVIGDALDGPGTCEATNKPEGSSCEVDGECTSQLCATDPVTQAGTCAAPVVCS